MVKGQLVCVGASQELKQRFGAGYDIHIKLNPNRSDDDVNSIKEIMETSLLCDIRDENLVIILSLRELFADELFWFLMMLFRPLFSRDL